MLIEEMKIMNPSEPTFWHFLCADGRMAHTGELVEAGKTYRIEGEPVLCVRGLHASARAIDALKYAPGPVVCLVTLGGTIVHGDDKSVAQERTVIAMADATSTLHEFACWCAEQALAPVDESDPRSVAAIETKRAWLRGEATDDELAAARDAAWDAAWDAAEDAQNEQLETMLRALLGVASWP